MRMKNMINVYVDVFRMLSFYDFLIAAPFVSVAPHWNQQSGAYCVKFRLDIFEYDVHQTGGQTYECKITIRSDCE